MSNDISHLRAEIRRLKELVSSLTPSLELMLKRRGFIIHKREPAEDLLIPDNKYSGEFYEKLKRYSFRLFLRDVIKHQNSFTIDNVSRYASKQVTGRYLRFLLRAELIEPFERGNYRLKKRPVKSFGETLEWFVSKLMEKDFHAEAIWGVKFRGHRVGGDYDLLAKIDTLLSYMEIKSSPPKQIYDTEIKAFFNRLEELSPDIAVFFVDTELRMKDKIVPMFEDELLRRYGKTVRVKRIKKELFHINRTVFIINAKGGISTNINAVLTFLWYNKFEIDQKGDKG